MEAELRQHGAVEAEPAGRIQHVGCLDPGRDSATAATRMMAQPTPPPNPPAPGGLAAARRVQLSAREKDVSSFAGRRPDVAGDINEQKMLGVLWGAIHHGRTLYGRPCTDLRSFFDACDTDGREAIVTDRLQDAMLRLGVGLTDQQVAALIQTIEVDVSGTVDFFELDAWMKRRDEATAREFAAGFDMGRAERDDLPPRVPWGSSARQLAVRSVAAAEKGRAKAKKAKSKGGKTPRLPNVNGEPQFHGHFPPEERHEFMRIPIKNPLPLDNPKEYVEPKASQLEAAIIMHERGFMKRHAIHCEKMRAADEARKEAASAYQQQVKDMAAEKMRAAEEARKVDIAHKFGLKMDEIDPEEWREVEADIEAQVDRRDKQRAKKKEMQDNPAAVKARRQRRKARRQAAATRIQAMARGMAARHVALAIRAELAKKRRLQQLQHRKRMVTCGDVLDTVINEVERQDTAAKMALREQLFKLQQQERQLEQQFHTFLDPSASEEQKAESKKLAEEAKYAQRWAKVAKKREDKARAKADAERKAIEAAKTELPALFDEEWSSLTRAQAAAAARLGFNSGCWPQLEENAVAAVPWARIESALHLDRVAGLLGLQVHNWSKVERCKPVPKKRYRILIGRPKKEVTDRLLEVQADADAPARASLGVRLHKLATFLSGKHRAILAKQVGSKPTTAEVENFYNRLCVGLQPAIEAGMPVQLARLFRKGLMEIGWAGGALQDSDSASHRDTSTDEEDESAARERALAEQLAEMKAFMAMAMGNSEPEPEPEPEEEPEETESHLIQLRAEETLSQLDRISGSTGAVVPAKPYGLRPDAAGCKDIAAFLRQAVQEVHALRSQVHSVRGATGAVLQKNAKPSTSEVVASLVNMCLRHENAKAHPDMMAQVQNRLLDAFRFFDRNGDGKISPKEMQLALRALSKGKDGTAGAGSSLSLKRIEKYMKQGDADGDGTLDFHEFAAHIHFHETESARKAAEAKVAEQQAAEEHANAMAAKMVSARNARVSAAKAAAEAKIAADAEAKALVFEARRVLPPAFNGSYSELSLAHEAAAHRLGFTADSWPRVASTSPCVAPWDRLQPALKRMAVVLGFEEAQQPPTWELIEVEGENGEGDVSTLGAVTTMRDAYAACVEEEDKRTLAREERHRRAQVFKEAAEVGALKIAAREASDAKEVLSAQRDQLRFWQEEEEAASTIQLSWARKKARDDEKDRVVLSEEDKAKLDAIWVWALMDSDSDILSRQQLTRHLMETDGRDLTDPLYEMMCSMLGADPAVGVTREMFESTYTEAIDGAQVAIARDFETLGLTLAPRPAAADEQALVVVHSDDSAKVPDTDAEKQAEEDAKVAQYADYLGIDVAAEKNLLWIAHRCMLAPLPQGWQEFTAEDGSSFYHNTDTDETSWDHPLDGHFKQLVADTRAGTAGMSPEREAQLRQIFARIDRNGASTVSRADVILRLRKDAELAELLQLPGKVGEQDREAFEALFQGMDTNRDNQVDADEFVAFFAHLGAAAGVGAVQNEADADADRLAAAAAAAPVQKQQVQKQPQARAPAHDFDSDSDSDSDDDVDISELRRRRAARG